VLLLQAHLRAVGPLRQDLYVNLAGRHWHYLLEAGVELRWDRYSDGTEYLPALLMPADSWQWCELGERLMALRAAGVDLSRHHICSCSNGGDGHGRCSWNHPGKFSYMMAAYGVTMR
jgi:hypothetical protein